MKKAVLDEALSLGFTTQAELKSFEYGYMSGEKHQLEKNLAELQNKSVQQIDDIGWLRNDWQPRTTFLKGDTK